VTGAAPPPPSVLIVEDHLAVRTGLAMLLRSRGVVVAGVAEDVAGGLRLTEARLPDVVIAALTLRTGSGIDLARELTAREDGPGVVVYTGSLDDVQLEAAATSGATGFVLKTSDAEELLLAIHAVARGDVYVDLAVKRLLGRRRARAPRITEREREILERLAGGATGEQIAHAMFLSPETIRTHLRNAMQRLDAHTRVQAVAVAMRDGEISFW
jgi:DNA-binding NarL/FixJ family response regulator